MLHRRILPILFLSLVFAATSIAFDLPKPAPPPPPISLALDEPWYVDDTKVLDLLTEKITELAKAKKAITQEKLVATMKPARPKLTLAKPGEKRLTPEDVYRQALPSVFVIGSVLKDKKTGEWVSGTYGSGWVAADGILVTNWHLFEDLEPGEVFGAADHKGNVYPITEFLGGDKTADVAVVKVAGTGLVPLPVATGAAPVASWIGILSHPGDHFYVFTQGHVTRYSRNTNEDGKAERWMGVTAEYASGSSGAPVLNDRGAVVGMTALTLTLDTPADDPKPKEKKDRRRIMRQPKPQDKPAPKDDPKAKPDPGAKDKPEAMPGVVQMVMKFAVPGPVLRDTIGK